MNANQTKFIVTHRTLVQLIVNKDGIFDQLEGKLDHLSLYAPQQLPELIPGTLRLSRKEFGEIEKQRLAELMQHITLIPVSNPTTNIRTAGIIEPFIEVYQKVQAVGIWDKFLHNYKGKRSISYYGNEEIIGISRQLEKQEYRTDSESSPTRIVPMSITNPWLSLDEWKKDTIPNHFKNMDFLNFIVNYLHFEGLICLNDRHKYYYNGEDSLILPEFKYDELNYHTPQLPVFEEPVEIWSIDPLRGHRQPYCNIDVFTKREILDYWELFIDDVKQPSSGKFEYHYNFYQKFQRSLMVVAFNPKAELTSVPEIKTVHLHSLLETYNISYTDDLEAIFRNGGSILRVGEKLFLTAEIHTMYHNSLEDIPEERPAWLKRIETTIKNRELE